MLATEVGFGKIRERGGEAAQEGKAMAYHQFCRALLLLCVTLGFAVAQDEPPPGDEPETPVASEGNLELPLKLEVLNTVDSILTKGDINFSSEFTPVRVEDGGIVPNERLRLERGKDPVIIDIGGKKLQLSLNGADLTYTFDGEKPRPLRRVAGEYPTLRLKAADGQRVAVGLAGVQQSRSGALDFSARNASVVKGKISVDEITLYDAGLSLAYSPDTSLYTLGKGMVFLPLTRQIATGRSIIEVVDIAEDGQKLTYRTVAPEQTGAFSIQFKGANLDAHMAFESEGGSLSFVDQGLERRTVLPVGKYRLAYGFVYARREKKVAAIMLPTPQMSLFEVQQGTNRKITVGTNVSLIFRVTRIKDDLIIDARNTSLEGKDGERYYSFRVIGEPEVAVRVSSKKRKKMYRLGSFCLT